MLLKRLVEKHEPAVAILACADARVCPEKVFNLSLGDAFVVRVVGNTASDPKTKASLEYAVKHLGVRALVVLGHTCCDAARIATSCYRDTELEPIAEDMERAKCLLEPESHKDRDALAEGNVWLQLRRLHDDCPIIREAVLSGRLSLLGAMLDIATGAVRFI